MSSAPDSAGGTTEGKRAGPEEDKKAEIVFICGDESGVGKTTVCMGILCGALQLGYAPEELAYIKPCTQCEDTQLLWKWCESEGITHEGLGPILYKPGYTQEVIDGEHGTAEERLDKVYRAVDALASAPGRKLVVVDGVGYPGVGSCTGTSNGDVARRLGAPVVLVGRPGIGNAIDSTVMAVHYFAHHGVPVVGALWNKIPKKVSYHTFERCKEYVGKFFATFTPVISDFGHVPVMRDKDGIEEADSGSCKVSCALRKPSRQALAMTPEDVERATSVCEHFLNHISVAAILARVAWFYAKRPTAAPATAVLQ